MRRDQSVAGLRCERIQATLGAMKIGLARWDTVVRDAARWHRRARLGDMAGCTTAAEVEQAAQVGRMGVIRGLGRPGRNLVGDGCTEPGHPLNRGISRFSANLIGRMNQLRIIVDVSHCGARTTLDAIECRNSPWPPPMPFAGP